MEDEDDQQQQQQHQELEEGEEAEEAEEPLCRVGEWEVYADDTTRKPYFFNAETGVVRSRG